MELLIPGLILVALMVYASTRIKKTAALAFEEETIETAAFIIQKPDGFLNVIGGDPQYAFEAYSKNFGGAGAEDLRQATAKLRIYDGISVDEVVANITNSGDEIANDLREVIGETHYRIVKAARIEKGIDLRVFYKIAEKNGKLYQLEITALAETTEEFIRNIEGMMDSFELK